MEAKVGSMREVDIKETSRRVDNEGTQGVKMKEVRIEGTQDEEWRDACGSVRSTWSTQQHEGCTDARQRGTRNEGMNARDGKV